MRSKRFFAKVLLIALAFVTVAVSCKKDEDDEVKPDETAIIGTWKSTLTGFQDYSFEFKEDKSGDYVIMGVIAQFKWEAKIVDEETGYFVTFPEEGLTIKGKKIDYFTVDDLFGEIELNIHYVGEDQYDGFGPKQ